MTRLDTGFIKANIYIDAIKTSKGNSGFNVKNSTRYKDVVVKKEPLMKMTGLLKK